jgi:hypothetical protein
MSLPGNVITTTHADGSIGHAPGRHFGAEVGTIGTIDAASITLAVNFGLRPGKIVIAGELMPEDL